jgi:signal peptidase II
VTEQETTKTSRLARQVQPLSLIVAGFWVLCDELSKHWAVNRLSNDRMVDVVGSLRFNLSYNSGMAFGKGKGFGPVLGVVALIVVVYVLIGLRTGASRWSAVAVGLVLGGAAGNLCDRLFRGSGWFRGSVVDFIDFQWWPVFNVADIGVTVGGLLLVVGTLKAGSAADSE